MASFPLALGAPPLLFFLPPDIDEYLLLLKAKLRKFQQEFCEESMQPTSRHRTH